MATVDKLLIRGIRSFSPENTHVITFPKPLTLIVGRNGSGKTTIIECLKHAVTGEWPPNSHAGKSFVHDPKVYGADDVKAQIKLQCKTVTGKPFLVIRSFQLTRKRASGKYEFKSLDQNIQISNQNGELEGLSKRCADINLEVPQLLGVSKAILENVIFVHQDDSNWPLAEGAVLKKKFDDIFAATKYTKALEAIRKIKTEQAQGIKEKKLVLKNLKTHKDNAHKLQTDLADAEKARAELFRNLETLEEAVQQRASELGSQRARLEQLSQVTSAIQVLKAKRDTTVAETAKRKAALVREVQNTSMEQLQAMQENFEGKKKQLQHQKADLERRLSDARIAITHLRDVHARETAKQSRLAAEAEMQVKRVLERQNFVAEAAQRHLDVGMRFVGVPTPDEVHQFEEKAMQRLRALQRELEEHMKTNQDRVTQATKAVDLATESVAGLAENIRMKTSQQRKNEAQLTSIARQLTEAPVSERQLEEETTRLKDMEALLEKKRAEAVASPVVDELAENGKSLESVKRELAALRRQRDELSTVAGVSGQVTLLRRDAADKEDAAAKAFATITPLLADLFGAEVIDQKSMGAKVSGLLRECEKTLSALEAELRKQQNLVASLEGRTTDARALAARQRESLKAKRDHLVNSVLNGAGLDTFQARLQESLKNQESAAQVLADLGAGSKMMDLGSRTAREKHICFMCERDLDAVQEAAFLQMTAVKAQNLPAAMRDRQEVLRTAKEEAAALQRALPSWEECQRLTEEDIPRADDTIRGLAADLAVAKDKLAELEGGLKAHKDRMQQASGVGSEAAAIARLLSDAGALRTRADDQQRAIAHLSTAAKTMDELAVEIGTAEKLMSDVEHKRNGLLDTQKRLQDDVVNLERAVAACREAVRAIEAKAARWNGLERERLELVAETDTLRRDLADMERRLVTLKAEKASAEDAREQLRKECASSEQERSLGVRSLQRNMDSLAMQVQAITAYIQAGKDETRQRSAQALAATQQELEEKGGVQNQMATELGALDDKLRNNDGLKRDLEDNVAFQQGLRMQESLSREIDEKQELLGDAGSLASIKAEVDALDGEVNRMRNEQHNLRGRMDTHKEIAEKCRKDLKDSAFKNIAERYRQANIELRTTEMANEDLNKYHTALDKALMAFHASKMAEINKVVKELWQKTYRNPDIDHIAIVSDAEATTGRSYNYRVVMKNREEELDMRGRCSAGQKVLACLIIRLALAETFCLNCGILALDEPTTNLDAANSASLASALMDIMNSRREQESFQLIVITHDVRFAHQLGSREHAEYYWRISKDEELHSHIEKEDIVD